MADPQQGPGAVNAAASVATQIPAPAPAAAAPRGLAAGEDERIERENALEADDSIARREHDAHPLTAEPENRAMAAPRASSDDAGARSSRSYIDPIPSPSTETVGADASEKNVGDESASIDEKVQEALQRKAAREDGSSTAGQDDNGSADSKKAGKKGKKGKKEKKVWDKRDPVEIALEDPELAHLDPERRKIIAEQIAVIKRPPAGFFELFRYSTKFEIFLNILGLFCSILAGVAQPAMTILFGNLTTAFTDFGKNPFAPNAKSNLYDAVNKDAAILVGIGAGSFVATWIYMYTWVYTGEVTTRRVREKYLKAILRQNIAFFDRLGPGEVTTRIETDTHLIQEGISEKVAISVFFVAIFISGFVIAIIRNWRLALVCSTIIPCIAIAGGVMNAFVSKYKQQQLEATADGATLAEEVIASVRSAHAFGNQDRLAGMYDEANQRTLKIGEKSAHFNGLGLGVFFFIIYGAYGLAFYYGTTLLLQNRITSGEVVNVFFSILIGAFSLAQLAPNLQAISFARGAATEIYATIDRKPIIDSESEVGLKPESVTGRIELEHIDFIYPSRPSVQVLYDFNGVFPEGKTTALVGGSGSGKSTIVGMIERFYDPVGGVVKIDGIPIKEWNIRYLRNQIGLVSQEPVLFATTVAGNIEHGLIGSRFEHETPEQKRARVIDAAKLANAHGFITALPDGYDTLVGERAMLLSGGQKQRIAIARAVVSDPKILLLDEATSALDTQSETIVQDALDRAAAGRTTISIAHRLSTIRDADQIIVLTAGHILESAMSSETAKAHDILLENPTGAYSQLVSAQRLREQEEAEAVDDSDSMGGAEQPVTPGELSREQIDEMARKEKPQFEGLNRTGTNRSLASKVLEDRGVDLEAGYGGESTKRNFPYLVKRIFKINADQWRQYILGFGFAVASGCVYPVFAIIFGGIIGVFQETGQQLRDDGNRYALYSFIVGIVATVCVIGQSWYYGETAERLSAKMRLGAFRAILRQDIAFFDEERNSTGHLTAQLADLATKVYGLFGVTQGVIIQSIFTIVAGAIIGLCYSWRIALVGIACIPFTLSAGIVRLRVVVLKDQKNKQAHAASAQMACEAAAAIRTVASLTREEDCSMLYSEQLDTPMRDSNRTAIWSNAFYSLSQALSFWVIALIFWYGSHQMVDNGLPVRNFFIAQIGVIFGSIQAGNVFSYVPDMSSARGAAAAYIELIDSEPSIDAEDTGGEKFDHDNAQGHIRFENVHFRYPTRLKVPVLRGLDFEVKPGQFIAFCGASGCGKSTTIQLVERFYDPISGRVIVDGQDISTLNVQSYRRAVALVQQEPTLYAGSIRFNIALGAYIPPEEVTQEQIETAAKQANIHDFVMGLPDGYDTEVGGKGASLSGGQKQRVAIARALIRNPKILLLDEATSALDSESEKVVQRALDQASKNRTTIAIAHRLSTIQNADCIYVLKDGVIAEAGSHDVLLSKRGLYFELVAQQSLASQH